MSDAAPCVIGAFNTPMRRETLVELRTRSLLASMGLFALLEGDVSE